MSFYKEFDENAKVEVETVNKYEKQLAKKKKKRRRKEKERKEKKSERRSGSRSKKKVKGKSVINLNTPHFKEYDNVMYNN